MTRAFRAACAGGPTWRSATRGWEAPAAGEGTDWTSGRTAGRTSGRRRRGSRRAGCRVGGRQSLTGGGGGWFPILDSINLEAQWIPHRKITLGEGGATLEQIVWFEAHRGEGGGRQGGLAPDRPQAAQPVAAILGALLNFGGLSDPTYWLINKGNHVYNRTRRDAQTLWGTAPVLCAVPLRVGDIPDPPLPPTRGLVTLGTALDSGGAAGVEEVPGKKVEDTG